MDKLQKHLALLNGGNTGSSTGSKTGSNNSSNVRSSSDVIQLTLPEKSTATNPLKEYFKKQQEEEAPEEDVISDHDKYVNSLLDNAFKNNK